VAETSNALALALLSVRALRIVAKGEVQMEHDRADSQKNTFSSPISSSNG
jgi:hypothetical protein